VAAKAELERKRKRAERTRAENRRLRALWWHEERLFRAGYRLVAGMDEAGRGPLAGPVVAAAVILPRDAVLRGVNDSKQLSEEQREALFCQVQKTALAVGVGISDVTAIDRYNILRATWMAMREALASLALEPEHVLLDGYPLPDCPFRQKAIVDGDCQSISIAAASIIAKVTRDRIMVELDRRYPQWGFAQHKGYSTPEHLEAIARYGICDIHRRSFAPVYETFQQRLPLEG